MVIMSKLKINSPMKSPMPKCMSIPMTMMCERSLVHTRYGKLISTNNVKPTPNAVMKE